MKQTQSDFIWTAALVLVALIGGAYYLLWMPRHPAPGEVRSSAPAPSTGKIAGPPAPPPIAHPIDEAPARPPETPPPAGAAPTPPVDEPAFEHALTDVLGAQFVQDHLNVQGFMQRLVATVDNLPRESVTKLLPLKPIGGQLAVTGDGENITIAPANAARYGALMRTLDATDPRRLAELYVRYYPLFQRAYEALGYPGRYFNDRLVQVIDHLLEAPESDGPVRVIQPRVMYQYADPSLESRSAGQKILMRIGKDNEARVKAKLREFRALIATSGRKAEKPEHPE